MRVVCPSCVTAYEVPDAVIASRRLMRCARCAHEFTPPVSPAAAEIPVPPPDISPALKRQVLAAWGASLLLLLVLSGAGVAWRRPVMQAWPASARLYAVLGFSQN